MAAVAGIVLQKFVLPLVLKKVIEKASPSRDVALDIVSQIEQDPKIANEMNAEAPYQSRVVVGSSVALAGALLTAVGTVWHMWQTGDFDISMLALQLSTAFSIGCVLYGRLATGLAPLFSRG